jgi:hypothetical protein
MAEAIKVDQDQHAQELEDAYLATRAKHRTLATERQGPLILEGILVHPLERRTGVAVLPAPLPTEALEMELFLPLTQPLPRGEANPQSSAAKEPQEPRNEAVRPDEVD